MILDKWKREKGGKPVYIADWVSLEPQSRTPELVAPGAMPSKCEKVKFGLPTTDFHALLPEDPYKDGRGDCIRT